LLGLWPLWVVVFTHLFGECRWGCLFSHIVRLLFIQQPGNTHGIYRHELSLRDDFGAVYIPGAVICVTKK